MNRKYNFFFLLLMLMVTMSVFRYLSSERNFLSVVRISRSVSPPLHQHLKERVFKEFSAERLSCIGKGSGNEGAMVGPLRAIADDRGNSFILDSGSLSVREYSPRGEYVRTFGRGKGQGPMQFMSISDFRVLPNGEVWVADLNGGKIEMFLPDGALRRTVRPSRRPYRVLPGEKGGFLLMLPPTSEHLFGRFGADASIQSEFGKLLDDRLDGVALDGWIGEAGKGDLLYVPYYFGWIASYSASGDLKYMVETIDRIPSPTVNHSGKSFLWMDPDMRVSAKSASVSEGNLYVLSGDAAGSRLSNLVDVYDAGSGAYRYSFKAPEAGTMVLVRGKSLYVVTNSSVCQWSLQPASPTLQAAL